MSYPDESPRRRFERASHRAEDWDEDPPRFGSDRPYGSGVAPIPQVPRRAQRIQMSPIEDTDPRVAVPIDYPMGGQSRREIVVRREQPGEFRQAPDPLVDHRRRVYTAAWILLGLCSILVLAAIFILGSYISSNLR